MRERKKDTIFYACKKLQNVCGEYDRWVVETQVYESTIWLLILSSTRFVVGRALMFVLSPREIYRAVTSLGFIQIS